MGGTPITGHLSRAYELLEDGQWHDREDIVAEMMKMITPGMALRAHDANRKSKRPTYDRTPRSLEFRVFSGQRLLSVYTLNRSKRIERRTEDNGVVHLRLRPPLIRRSETPNATPRTT